MRKICLIIGHGQHKQNLKGEWYREPGAVSQDKKYCEFKYNSELVQKIADRLKEEYDILIENRGYNSIEDTSKINTFNPELIISFHCNAANTTASGTEAIYHPGSTQGKKLATIVSENVSKALELKNRGAKEPFDGRGSGLLSRTKAPCIISEGFFIDNNSDLKKGLDGIDKYVLAIEKSIHEFLGDNEKEISPDPVLTKKEIELFDKSGNLLGTIRI